MKGNWKMERVAKEQNVLLIWSCSHEIPELYLIKNPTKEEIELLEKAHNRFISVNPEEEVQEVLTVEQYLCNPKDCIDSDDPDNGKWFKSGLNIGDPIRQHIDTIYICGWVA
jgi:hypothetical protein